MYKVCKTKPHVRTKGEGHGWPVSLALTANCPFFAKFCEQHVMLGKLRDGRSSFAGAPSREGESVSSLFFFKALHAQGHAETNLGFPACHLFCCILLNSWRQFPPSCRWQSVAAFLPGGAWGTTQTFLRVGMQSYGTIGLVFAYCVSASRENL